MQRTRPSNCQTSPHWLHPVCRTGLSASKRRARAPGTASRSRKVVQAAALDVDEVTFSSSQQLQEMMVAVTDDGDGDERRQQRSGGAATAPPPAMAVMLPPRHGGCSVAQAVCIIHTHHVCIIMCASCQPTAAPPGMRQPEGEHREMEKETTALLLDGLK
jgi:hypothetical protein